MNILGVDLGRKTGLAYHDAGGLYVCHTLALATSAEERKWSNERMDRRRDPRVERLHRHLCNLNEDVGGFDIVVFEDVEFASSTYQVQLWSAFRTALWLAFPNAVVDCVNVKILKKFATGSGGADKSYMSAALKAQYRELWTPTLDDNAIDAAWLKIWAKEHLGRTVLTNRKPVLPV